MVSFLGAFVVLSGEEGSQKLGLDDGLVIIHQLEDTTIITVVHCFSAE